MPSAGEAWQQQVRRAVAIEFDRFIAAGSAERRAGPARAALRPQWYRQNGGVGWWSKEQGNVGGGPLAFA